MSYTCRNFLRLAPQFQIRLLTANADLNRPISWLHYLENPAYTDWLRGNELVLTTGMLLKTNGEKYCRLIDDIYEKNAAGLIINLSPYVKAVPEDVIAYADFLGFPLFEMPAQCAIVEISEAVGKALLEHTSRQSKCAGLLHSLLYDQPRISASLIRKAADCGYQPGSPYRCLLFHSTHPLKAADIGSFNDPGEDDVLSLLENTLYSFFSSLEHKILSLRLDDRLLCLLPSDESDATPLRESLEKLLLSFEENKNIPVTAGISPLWYSLDQFLSSYQKASQALRFLSLTSPQGRVAAYEDLGTLALLLSKYPQGDRNLLSPRTLAPLIANDADTGGELTPTLRAFLWHSGSWKDTAAALFIHVNTLRYRIHKIEEILGLSLRDWNVLFSLMLEFYVMDYLDGQAR